ncbi:hypothetical protein N7530_011142 [Penicillium desertorum]|uniref:Uncharacterized protein n=1 Tax=Penicillium desertorum TaxID=1303715 RepID=A0A9X0BH83_9EURO|nr:hypothetical protein N7530_011142 [Penicillium desertorum]
MTFCPLASEYDLSTEVLGENKPLARMSITKVIPRSATLYHELIHLAPNGTPSKKEEEKTRQYWDGMKYQDIIRQNPETFVFFSTIWNKNTRKRWSFDTGVARLVAI